MFGDVDDEKRVLSLLEYALKKKGVEGSTFLIGKSGDEKQHDEVFCLVKTLAGGWDVFYTERGSVSQRVSHQTLWDAATDFYWKLTRRDTPWDFREEWEAETGQTL